MAKLKRPPDPRDPDAFDRLARNWWRYCERWAAYQSAIRPGIDFELPANLALWKAAATYDPARGGFRTHLDWQLRSARSHALQNDRRRAARGLASVGRLGDFEPAYHDRRPDESPDFDAIIGRLPDPRQREVIRLRFAEGLIGREAGERLNIKKSWVSVQEKRALALLREAI